MTAPHPRDPRLRRGQPADPLAAALRLSMSVDAMRGEQLERGPEPPAPLVAADPDVELRELLAAAVQGGTHEPRLTAAEFAAYLADDVPDGFALDVAALDVVDIASANPAVAGGVVDAYRLQDAIVAESVEPAPSLPPAAPAPVVDRAVRAFRTERSTPPLAWRSRHDPRSRAYGIRPRLAGSTPLQERLLPAGPVLDQVTAGVTLEEQSCCTGTGTVAAVNTLRLLSPAARHEPRESYLLGLDDAAAIYQRGQQLDEYPGDDYPGGSVLGAMSAALELGHIGGYLWCFGTRDVAQAILTGRPVVVGVPWLSGMWETGPGGLVVLEGADEGLGHCLAVNGIRTRGPNGEQGAHFRWQQSSGESYGVGGFGWIHHRDLAGLLRGRGEAATPTLEAQEPAA